MRFSAASAEKTDKKPEEPETSEKDEVVEVEKSFETITLSLSFCKKLLFWK